MSAAVETPCPSVADEVEALAAELRPRLMRKAIETARKQFLANELFVPVDELLDGYKRSKDFRRVEALVQSEAADLAVLCWLAEERERRSEWEARVAACLERAGVPL